MTTAIELSEGRLSVQIWPLGARLNGVWFDGVGNLVDGSDTVEEAFGAKKYNGAVVGPVANRIANGSAALNGNTYSFEKNEGGITSLHSGPDGVHTLDWTIDAQTQTDVTLSLGLPDGLGGFPGNRRLSARYAVQDDALEVVFRATTDAPTWINLALHPYWRLAESGREGARLFVNADAYLPVDAAKIPTGEIADVENSIFDLRSFDAPSHDIDHNFCLTPATGPAVSIEGDLGVRLDVTTDAPGVQIYSGKPIGIAIEPQHWPDAMHHPGFPSIVLEPGAEYVQSSIYRFSRV